MATHSCNFSYAYVQTTFLAPVYTVEFFLAMLGNGFAIWLLGPGGSKKRHAGIIFSLNLAVSDMAYALSLPLLVAYYSMGKTWIFGNALCKVERFLFHLNLYGSIFFITCISVNRCIGVVYPFYARGHVESKHAKITSVAVWLMVAIISSPVFHFSRTKVEKHRIECLGTAQDSQLKSYFPYSLFLAVFGCGIPFIITLISYIGIGRAVMKSHGLEPQEKRKVVTMVCIVVFLYAISFLPYHILRNLNLANRIWPPKDCKQSAIVHSAFQVTRGLVALNPSIHPLLYTSVIDNVRARLSCRKVQEGENPPESIRQ